MSEVRANSITNAAGTGAPDFPNGITAATIPAANLTGALPAISGAALTNLPAPTSAQVGTATAGLAYGAVGSYGLFFCGSTLSPGSTIAGSSLQPSNTYQNGSNWGGATVYGAPSGTWRLMGQTAYYNGTISFVGSSIQASVFLRIS